MVLNITTMALRMAVNVRKVSTFLTAVDIGKEIINHKIGSNLRPSTG